MARRRGITAGFFSALALLLFLAGSGLAEAPAAGLMISEVVSGNYRSYAADGVRGLDVIELVNLGPGTVQLSDYCLSDSKKNLSKYALPSRRLKPGAWYLVLCDNDGRKGTAPFQISSAGETIYLSDQAGRIVDRMKVPALPIDVSYGRNSRREERYFAAFTPGTANGDGYERVAETPVIDMPSGGYTAAFSVRIQGEEPIYYTLDGSIPTAKSHLYTGPVTISGTTCLRAVSLPEGAIPSPAATALYRFDAAGGALPVLTVSLPKSYLRGNAFSLLAHTQDKAMAVPAAVTMTDADGTLIFSRDCGLGIAGQTSRDWTWRNWKLKFKSMYGGPLRAELFPGAGEGEYDSLNLRVGSTLNPVHDALGTALGQDVMTDVLCQRFRPVHLIIREEDYGVYFLRENINKHFVASRLGGSENAVDIIYRAYDVEEGSGEDWEALLRFCRTADMKDPENYAAVCGQVNITGLIDYYIWRAYTGDTDYANLRMARCRDAADPRWHLIMYDLDWAFRVRNKNDYGLQFYAYTRYDGSKHNNLLPNALFANEEFRALFLERLEYHLRVTFAPERVLGLLDGIVSEVAAEMPNTFAIGRGSPRKWEQDIQEIRDFVGSGDTDRRLRLVRETARYLKLSKEQETEIFGFLRP